MSNKQADYSEEAARQAGLALMTLSAHMQGYREWPMQITGFTCRGPRVPGEEFLITLRAIDADEAPWVAFHSAFDLHDAVRGAMERAKNGTLKWKPDQFAK